MRGGVDMLEYQDLKAAFAANANTKLASGMKKFLTYDDLPRIEKFVRPKQWWV